jgi:hypothetical protein
VKLKQNTNRNTQKRKLREEEAPPANLHMEDRDGRKDSGRGLMRGDARKSAAEFGGRVHDICSDDDSSTAASKLTITMYLRR